MSIIPVKVLSDSGSGSSVGVANGIRWATDNGADIISMSLGGGYSSTIAVQVAYAIQNGVTVIAAAGNERAQGSPASYPAALPGVLAVAATDSNNNVANFSNAGSYVDISAPESGSGQPSRTTRTPRGVVPPWQHRTFLPSRHWCCRGLLNSTWPSRLTCC